MNVNAASGTDGASGTGNRTAARRVRKQASSGALPGQFPGTSGYRGAGDLMCCKCHMERLWQPIRRLGQPPPLAAWISRTLTLRAQLAGFRLAPGTGLQPAGGGPSWMPTAQQACQVSVAVMFQVPGWRKVTPQSAVPLAPVRATLPGLLTISFEPR